MIKGCLSYDKASILVNGMPKKEICIKRVVREWDPLSPFLFIMAMEGLSISLNKLVEHFWICFLLKFDGNLYIVGLCEEKTGLKSQIKP